MQIIFRSDARQELWFEYYGIDPKTNQQAHADASGNLVASVPSVKPTPAHSYQASSSPSAFPMLSVARLYVSLGGPLLFVVDPVGKPLPPAPADEHAPFSRRFQPATL